MKNISIIYKISILLLIITLVPLAIISFLIVSDLPVLKDRIENASQSLSKESDSHFQNVGDIAIKNSKDTLDAQSEKIIRIRLLEISKQISEFLRSAQEDTLLLARQNQDTQIYLTFVNTKKKAVWFNTDTYDMLPVYSEVSFIGTDGVERIKIRNGSIRNDYVDLSNDRNLEFKARATPDGPVINYFKEGMKLKEGEIYESHIEGRILNITEAHAGNKNPTGKYAHGVQRFVTPVYRNGEKIGILMVGLDSIHILEYMQHIRPLDYERLPLTDLLSGDYLALLDDEGWLLHPKQYFSKGYDKNGELVPPISEDNFEEYNRSGLSPMHIPGSKILWGKSGDEYMKRIMNSLYITGEDGFFSEQVLEGKTKVTVWVPITYGREYGDRAVNMKRGYGFLFASSEWPVFYQSSAVLGDLIKNESDNLSNELKETTRVLSANIDESVQRIFNRIPYILILIITMTLIFVGAGIYLIVRPLRMVTAGAKAIGEGCLDCRINIASKDEMGELANSFNNMAYELQNKSSEMKKKTQELTALYTVAKTLSRSLDLDKILRDTLKTVLQIMGAQGGGIYLVEEDGRYLNLKVHVGLSPKFIEVVKKIEFGTGISGEAAKLKKPVSMEISGYPTSYLVPLLQEEMVKSLASAPLLYKEKILGAINIIYRRPYSFSQEELDLFGSIASELGVAIENSRLFSELERHNKMLDTLYAIESVVSRSLDLEEIFNVALSKALEVTETEAGTLYSLDGDILRLEAFSGLSTEFKENALFRKMGEGIPGIAAQLEKPITIDISQFPSPGLLPYIEKEGLVSFIGTPLMSKGKVVGAMSLGTSKKRIFTKEDLDLLFSIGNVIGIAAENARLYKESRENLQKLQKAYQELQTLDKMKDDLISNVSHELKTPLISIKGYGELLYDEKLGGLSEEQKKSLEAIIRNADRLTRLINSILFISKLQAGKIEFKFESLDMKEILKMCVDDFKRIMDKKQIQLEIDIPEIPHILGDKDRFIEVITNLLENAIKFTPDRGNISIKAQCEEEFVHIIVSDNGIGISTEILPKLFTRFYQVDASTARKFGGTGLGLYITKNIIDAFKGKIWIESEVGKGTTVHVLLPVSKNNIKIK
jgi:signal transduction histidine kinase/HAMP domain-containing protein